LFYDARRRGGRYSFLVSIGAAHDPWDHASATLRRVLAAEFWQFLVAGVVFMVLAMLWLFVVYLPGRTLERWEDQRPGRSGKKRGGSGRAG
jgi:hypothetical protein